MKKIKLLIVTTAFIIMIASIVNILNYISADNSLLGVYLELIAIGFLTVVIIMLHFKKEQK